ncbi:MAG: hypothetical protein J6A84_02525 [Clostridia bacterium]|nr:hypothetical protein [Clostridia bacterium]
MLYEENKKQRKLDKKLFQNPTAEYRGTPFWGWNCDLDKEELLRQIGIFKEMGFGGFHMHCRAGMSTTYLSDEFMDLVRACVDEAKKKEMLAWLYDEDRWPSGFGGGYVTKDYALRQRAMVFSCDPEYPMTELSSVLARFDVVLGEDKCLRSYKMVNEGDAVEGTLWTVYHEINANSARMNNQAYVDTLNPKAIQKFLEVTHDRYFEKVGDEFGKTIPSIFTDEPQSARKSTLGFAESRQNVRLPWTDDLEESYQAAYGESLLEHLPELLWDLPNGAPSLTRYRYHDHVAERFASAFADTCGKWCDDHGIALTGHMMGEQTLHTQTICLGDCMRSYRAFGIPGVDILCAEFEVTTAKQCQSTVRQYGRPGMMSELYGVTGWDFDFRGHKLHGDWQATLGVTVRVPHLAWVSMKGTAKRDYPASISYQSSWYKEYSYVEDHFGRLNTALTRGKPCVRVGVVHPVESYWLRFGPNEQTALVREKLDTNFKNVTDWLLRGNIDFDFICESLLPSLCEKGSAPLRVGEMAYDVVVVPECETLRSTTLERLEAFRAAGGKLVFMGDAPKYEGAVPSSRGKKLFDRSVQIAFSKGALLAELDENRDVEIRETSGIYTSNLIHQLRRDETGLWLFVSHLQEPYNKDVARAQSVRISVKGRYKPQLWDTMTGEVKPVAYTNQGGKTTISMTLFDYDSALIFLEDTAEDGEWAPAPSAPMTQLGDLPVLVDYTLSEPNVLLLDMPRYALDDEPLVGPEEILRADATIRRRLDYPRSKAQPWLIEKKKAEHTVTLEFTVNSEIDYDAPILALENPEVCTIVWNGEQVTYKDLGYYTDAAIRKTALPALKKGVNILRVTMPFGQRDNCESMYLLGQFGVRIAGRVLTVTALPEKLGFSDLTYQGLPFYGGVVSYHIPVEMQSACEAVLQIPHFTAAVNTVALDGEKKGTVAYPPYACALGELTAGQHTVTVNCYMTRRNCFGDVHNADENHRWKGAVAWFTRDSFWTYEYRFRRTGVLTQPWLFKKEEITEQ